MRYLIALFVLCAPAFAQTDTNPACYNSRLNLQSTAQPSVVNTLRINASDQAINNNYTLTAYIDDPTNSLSGHAITATTGGTNTAVFQTTTAAWASTGIDPRDGAVHVFTASMTSFSHGVLRCVSGFPQNFSWNIGASVANNGHALFSNAFGGTILNTTVNVALVVNTNNPNSVGTTGTPTCTSGGNSVFPNGLASSAVSIYGVPCANVIYCNGPVTATITQAAMATMIGTCTAVPAAVKFMALVWAFPNQITGISSTTSGGTQTNQSQDVATYMAYNLLAATTNVVKSDVIYSTGAVTQGAPLFNNPFAFTSATDARSCCGILPAAYLMGMACSGGSCPFAGWTENVANGVTLLTNGKTAQFSNPTGGTFFLPQNTGNFTVSSAYNLQGPALTGTNTGVAPTSINMTVSNPNNPGTVITTTNIVAYIYPGFPDQTSTPTFVNSGTGIFWPPISFPGQWNNGGEFNMGQSLLFGAQFTCGSLVEPAAVGFTRYPDVVVFMSGYTRGMSALEAMWKSFDSISDTSCIGNPFAQPFSNSFTGGSSGGSVVSTGAAFNGFSIQ